MRGISLPGILILTLSCGASAAPQENKSPLRVFIRAGVKTHGPGEHDHPRFLVDWKDLLKARGAEVDGAMEFPTAAQLEKTDVLVLFAAEGGTVAPAERERLDAFLKRGGGIVAIHDSVCGKDPHWFKTVIGGAWEHGKSKWHHGTVGIYVQDFQHPITQGVANFFIDDEIYWDLHLMPEAKVLATGFRTAHEITPQMWVYEKDAYRAFVNLQGHKYASFGLPHYRAILLRGIAWAAKRDVDLLVTKDEIMSLRYPDGGPTAPAKAREKIEIHKDFEAALVLAEPDVVKPISAGWDAKGRLWLALTPQYPNKASVARTRPHDQIVTFEDKKRTVFYDELDLVTSLVFHKDGVIVTQAPDILWLRDTDGDGKADRREVLFTGFGFGDTHATTSNLRWGQDGWIYGTQGYSGNSSKVVNKDGKDFGKIGNGLFRFKPDGSEIEVVCSYGSNTWGMDFSWDNEIFFTMANESHLRHVVLPDAVLSRGKVGQTPGWKFIADHRDANPLIKDRLHPYQQIDCVGGFTAAAGSTLYDGGAWPDEYRQIHFVTECTINLLHQDRIVPDGVTFKASKVAADEFATATDLWFRPIDTQIGPDGALYVLDFYNLAAVHNDTRGPKHGPYNAAVRPDRDHLHGRVWRIQHKQPKALPITDFTGVAGLVAALEHPNRWARLTAQRLLCERGEGAEAVEALLKTTAKPETKVLCLWTLQRLGKVTAAHLVEGLGDATAGVRKNAARIAGLTTLAGRPLADLVEDGDPRVRLEAIVALGSFPARPTDALVKAYPKLQDEWSRSAALGTLAGVVDKAFAAALRAGDRGLVEELAGLAGGRQDAALAAAVVTEAAAHPAEANPLKAAALIRLARALKADVSPPPSAALQKSLETLLASGDGSVVAATLPFAARWVKDDSMAKALEPVTNALLASLADAAKADDVRAQNLATLLSIPGVRAKAIEAGAKLLDPASSADLQRGAIEALGSVPDLAAGRAIVGAFRALGGASRDLIVSQLLKRPEWAQELLAAIEQERLRPADLGPGAIFRLRNHPDRATARKAAAVIDKVQGGENKAKDQIIAQLLPIVEKSGDFAKGKALFVENCLKCHSYKGEGKSVSPDLTGMGVHPKAELLVHIIDPNRSVEGNYVSYNLRTKGGEVFNGLIAREGKDSVTLKNNEGEREFRRSDIDVMLSTGLSLMPTGLEGLGGEVLRDILTYLAADAGGFRVVDLQTAFTASTVRGLYDPRREPNNLRLKKYGIVTVDGIPFQLVDPAKSLNGNNAIVLKGGQQPDWHCKAHAPQKVEVIVGFAFDRLHVLGGIAAWGTLSADKRPSPIVKVTFHYADGETDLKVLRDAVEFSDWIRRVDVPGSKYAEGLVAEGGRGQVRWLTLKPSRKAVVHHLTLESYDNTMAPTFLALTAEVGGAPRASGSKTLIVGGGSSHDFDRWFKGADGELLGASYTADPKEILPALPGLEILVLSNNQPIADPATRKGVFDFLEAGKGLVLLHPAAWYNWKDWPEYNRTLVGGGSRGHEKYQEFEITVTDEAHPVTAGVPQTFRVRDELYRHERDPQGSEVQVLARGKSLETGKEYPVVWTVAHAKGRIVCITLGHDGAVHEHESYKKLLKNAQAWVSRAK